MEVLWTNFKNAEEVSVLQKSVFIFSTSYWILFHDTETEKQSTYTADHLKGSGDGVRCVAGHDSNAIFAFAEMGPSPRVLVKSYPCFGTVTELRNPETQSYLSLCFSDRDHLVALSGINSFAMEVWNWRTSQLLGVQRTDVLSVSQSIGCVAHNQISIVQFASNLKQLKVWNLSFCCDSMNMTEVQLNCKKGLSIGGYVALREDWLLIYDVSGSILLYSIAKRTTSTIDSNLGEIVTMAAIEEGFVCCTLNELLVYTSGDAEDMCFVRLRSIRISSPLLKILTLDGKRSFALLETGEWGVLSLSTEVHVRRKFSVNLQTSKFESLSNDVIVLVNQNNSIDIRRLNDRALLQSFDTLTNREITCMTVNSSNSCLCFGTADSKVLVYLLEEFVLLSELFLSDNPIIGIKYLESFLVCSDQSGCYFIVDSNSWEILTYVSYSEPLLHQITVECNRNDLRLHFFKQMTGNEFCCDQLEIFQYKASLSVTTKKSVQLPFPIASVAYLETKQHFIVNPYLTRDLKAISIVQVQEEIIVEVIENWGYRSQTKYFNLHSQGGLVFVYGLDGQITLLTDSGTEPKSITIAHRLQGEIKRILYCPNSNFVLASDSAQNLVCLKLNSRRCDAPRLKPPPNTPTKVNSATISWLESRHHKNLQSELQNNKQICNEMVFQMQILRKGVQVLVDQNEEKPDDERLSIQQFNLNETHHKLLHQEAHSADLDTKSDMLKLIEEEKRVQQWLLDNYWHRMEVKSTSIKGIFENIQTENFSLYFVAPEWEQRLSTAILRFRIEQLTNSDIFRPFAPISTNQLERILSQEPICSESVNSQSILKRQSPKDSGTTTMNYIQSMYPRYNQMEVVTYQQCHMEELFGFFEVLFLKRHFNAKFNELHEQKARQMDCIRVKNERLRVIQKELNDLASLCNSRIKYNEGIVDPEFTIEEKPELIIQVGDHEMTCKPFQAVSERTQQSEDYSEEDVMQDMFSAAFRDSCLQTMMDGVLEIRWEDEIKKVPAIPVALQARKDLMDYDEHDLRAVKEYEEKLNFLGQERAKYKKVLLAERQRLQEDLKTIQISFNGQLTELINAKIDVEMAVNQEYFKLLRNRQFNQKRIDFGCAETGIKDRVQIIKREMALISTSIHDFDKKILELRAQLESSEARDRQLDKQFKNNFAEVSSHAIVDQAYKFFKRRSRWTPKAWATSAILNDMARRVINRSMDPTGSPLHEDCFEFLSILEQHDQATNCPNIMDERLWDLLCRMRRAKIESEFKVRALTAQMAEAESAEQSLSREMSYKKMDLVALDKEMMELRQDKQVNMINRTMQLVAKRGTIEVNLTGRLSDFDDTILIAKSEVDDINRMIRRTGGRKLKAMNNAAIFRRKVLHKDWEHQVLKLRIQEMRGFVRIVEKCKITKDVQRWLVKKQKGRSDDVSQVALNKEIDSMVAGFQRELLKVETDLKVLCGKISNQRLRNAQLDSEIESLNLDVNEQQKQHDPELEEEIITGQNSRFLAICERTRLMRKIQKQHAQIVELTAVLELQRMRTYPTLNEYRSA